MSTRILEPFRSPQSEVKSLVARSFLSDEAKKDFYERYEDRLKALAAGL